jgi:hypothetical protein
MEPSEISYLARKLRVPLWLMTGCVALFIIGSWVLLVVIIVLGLRYLPYL